MGKYVKEIRSFKLLMLEHAIQRNILKKYDNFLSELSDIKTNINQLKILILDLKKEIKKLDHYDIKLFKKFGELHMYVCDYSGVANSIIDKILSFLEDNNNIKFNDIVFPEGDVIKHNLFPKIEIEVINFNRIHISDLPKILRGIGIGKIVYKSMINKLGYISSIGIDRTEDAELVWDSISKDKNIYSFVSDKKIISITRNIKLEEILELLRKYFEFELKNNYPIILDSNFRKTFNIKVELLNDLK